MSKRNAAPGRSKPAASAATKRRSGPRSQDSLNAPTATKRRSGPRSLESLNVPTATKRTSARNTETFDSIETKRQGERPDATPTRAPKQRTTRAKRLVVRGPNQEIKDRARTLKEKRTDLDRLEPMRLQKALAASGIGSRREMEDWIKQGLVNINGQVAVLGDKVHPRDRVTVKGKQVNVKWPDRLPRVLLYYKQEGEIVSRDDPQGRVTIFDRLPQTNSSRWVAIGRLDVNTSGLLILTTSGELVNRFAHPSFEVEREYAVRILGEVSTDTMKLLCEGIELEDGPAKIERMQEQGGEGANKWYNVVIKEGRNREVRRIFESQEFIVSRLVRTRFGPIGLPARLKRGQFYELNEYEVANIVKWAQMPLPGERVRRAAPVTVTE